MSFNCDLMYSPEQDVGVNFEITENKPFNTCFQCRSFRNGCSGPNLSVMGVKRACEFLQMARIFLKRTYQDVADNTNLALATVKRTLTGKIASPEFYTISVIAVYLLGDPNGKYPCAYPNIDDDSTQKLNAALLELERALNDNADYREALDGIHASYNAEMQQLREEAQRKIDFLLTTLEEARAEAKYWRAENERKGNLIDKYMEKIITR